MNKLNVSAIILAGGRATRLNGEDKGLYLYENKPLISYVLAALKHQVADVVISANRNLKKYKNFGYPVVSDGNNDFEGPLKGLSEALVLCQFEKVLVTSCDMPFLPTNLLDIFELQSNADIQIVSVAGRMQLCFLMDKSLQLSLQEYLQSGGNRVMKWIKSLDYIEIEYQSDPEHFKNLNHPQDFISQNLLN